MDPSLTKEWRLMTSEISCPNANWVLLPVRCDLINCLEYMSTPISSSLPQYLIKIPIILFLLWLLCSRGNNWSVVVTLIKLCQHFVNIFLAIKTYVYIQIPILHFTKLNSSTSLKGKEYRSFSCLEKYKMIFLVWFYIEFQPILSFRLSVVAEFLVLSW